MVSLRRSSTPARPSIEQLLDEQVDALDRLMAEVRLGIRGPAHYDRLEQQAGDIADRLRVAFRAGPRP